MTNFCRNCGTRLPEGALFCPACGNKVAEPGPAPAPQYNMNQRQGRQTAAPKKKGFGILPVLALFVLVIAGLLISGILKLPEEPGGSPGKKIKGGKEGTYGGIVDPDENAALSQVDPDRLWLPPEPEDILLDYSAEEAAKAPETVMQVSPENPSAEKGSFAVDFGSWNLVGEESFSIRELPIRTYEKEGYAVRIYDLSLASGRTEFMSEVKVTVPRSEKDGDEVMFVTKDPETGKNEEEYFEISEDGRSYVLYTTHFSDHGLVNISDYGKNFSEAVRRGDVTGQETREALSAFYYPTRVPWNERMTAPVRFSPNDLWSKAMDKYAYLPASYSLMGAAAEKIRSNPQKTVPKEVNFGGLLVFDTNTLEEMFSDGTTGVDQLNNVRGITIEPGLKALNKLSLENVSPGLKEMVKGTVKSDFFNHVSFATTAIGLFLTNEKAFRELQAGKYSTDSQAFWGNWRDYAGTLVGVIGLTGAVFSTPVSVTAALGGLSLYFISKSYQTPYDDLAGAELNYREYYSAGGVPRIFFYDEPVYANNAYGINGAVGNIRPVSTLSPQQNQLLKKAINEDLKRYNGIGGLRGEDTRSKVINAEWFAVMMIINEMLKDEPEKIAPTVQEFYRNYTKACWDMGDEAFLQFSRTAMKARKEEPSAARLPSEEGSSEDKYAEVLEKELFIKHQNIFFDVAKQMEHAEQILVNKMIRTELVPLLNTSMEFTVKDKSLKKPAEFSKSIYSKDLKPTGKMETCQTENGRYTDFSKNYLSPMYFCVKDQGGEYEHVYRPVFMPSVNFSKNYQEYDNYVVGLSLLKGFYEDYYPAKKNFLPALTDKKGNVVFRCTYFHYLMMGAPTAMAFLDVDEKDGAEIIVPFEIPDKPGSDGALHVEIEVDPGEQGVWELAELVYESHYHFEPTYRDTSGMSSEERAKELKKHLFEENYVDRSIQADPDHYVYDDDTRGGIPPRTGPIHSEDRLPGTGGTRDELIRNIRDIGHQVNIKVLPSEGKPFSDPKNIPVAKPGGNRRLCIKYNYIVMVYRETGGRTASKTAWTHVDENSSKYWNRVVEGK